MLKEQGTGRPIRWFVPLPVTPAVDSGAHPGVVPPLECPFPRKAILRRIPNRAQQEFGGRFRLDRDPGLTGKIAPQTKSLVCRLTVKVNCRTFQTPRSSAPRASLRSLCRAKTKRSSLRHSAGLRR